MKKKRAREGRKSPSGNQGWMVAVLLVLGAITYGLVRQQTPDPKPPTTIRRTAPPRVPRASPTARPQTTRPMPPYHESAEAAKPFPQLVPATYFRNYPLVERVYKMAGEIPDVVAQQPCYCYCDKFGHRSLLDCYASDHGAG